MGHQVWTYLIGGVVAALYLAAFVLLFHNVIVFVIGQKRYQAKSKLLTIFYLNAFLLLVFQIVQYCNQLFNPLNFKVTVVFLSAAGIITLNTGIVMILMMVEIKSIFNSSTFKDLSEKKTNQIMIAGLITGIAVDLPVEICWGFDSF
jgi:hypothetical protein